MLTSYQNRNSFYMTYVSPSCCEVVSNAVLRQVYLTLVFCMCWPTVDTLPLMMCWRLDYFLSSPEVFSREARHSLAKSNQGFHQPRVWWMWQVGKSLVGKYAIHLPSFMTAVIHKTKSNRGLPEKIPNWLFNIQNWGYFVQLGIGDFCFWLCFTWLRNPQSPIGYIIPNLWFLYLQGPREVDQQWINSGVK